MRFRQFKDLFNDRRTVLNNKIKESLSSVLPVTLIVLVLCFSVVPIPADIFLMFVMGAFMLIIGMGLFTLGVDMSMMTMGQHIGSSLTRSKKIYYMLGVAFFVGFMITISEPDLQVLANHAPAIPTMTLIIAVGIGVGVFMMISMLRIIFQIKLSYLLFGFYSLVMVLTFFVNPDFVPVAFDSGGVTTGPMTVPFILALGIGVSSMRSDSNAESDSFGLVALCSIGPILSVLILGILFPNSGESSSVSNVAESVYAGDSAELFQMFLKAFPNYFKEVAIAVAPIVVFFFVYQLFYIKLNRAKLSKILVGVAYTYFGLVLFLTGVNAGFMPAGSYIGEVMATSKFPWLMIPVGMLIGYFIISAEPAVHILIKQVEEITSGAVSGKSISISLSVGVAFSVGIGILRVLTGISLLWFVIPGYIIALSLSFFTPSVFTAIAFDSGGVASGPMAATFLLPFAMGASKAIGGNVVTDAFGLIALVAMTPLITVQLLGVFYQLKLRRSEKASNGMVLSPEDISQSESDEDIIEF